MSDSKRIAILDANAIVDLKRVRVGVQWEVLRRLEGMVSDGLICVPGVVISEVSDVPHPDGPGIWAKGIEKKQSVPLEPDATFVKWVMAGDLGSPPLWEFHFPSRGVPEVLDQQADSEQADPYVVAMALQLRAEGRKCVVVTRDTKDRPGKISPASACRILGIPTTNIEHYLESIAEFIDTERMIKAAEDIRRWHRRRQTK